MLEGCVPWPAEFARRYVEAGLWEGITVAEMVERSARRQPQNELIAHLRAQQIASFKLPERLEVMSAFPVSPVGKILKRELREVVAQRMAGENVRQPG
jgi:non-ribosomal peptide synthetase component E (peptide arylation enzyme)